MKFLVGERSAKVAYDVEVARKFGINAAIILGRIIWSIEFHMAKDQREFFKEDRWWMYDTRKALAEYSGLTDKQIKLVLASLRDKKIIEIGQFDHQFNVRRNWFSLNIENLLAELAPIGPFGTTLLVPFVPINWSLWAQYFLCTKNPSEISPNINSDKIIAEIKKPKEKTRKPKRGKNDTAKVDYSADDGKWGPDYSDDNPWGDIS